MRWAERMAAGEPYASLEAVLDAARRAFAGLERADWLEAFAAHARIGELRDDEPHGAAEQARAASASEQERDALRAGNAAYEARFGHVFLIAAAGRDAAEILAALAARIGNDPARELELAAAEQVRITRSRLHALLGT